MTGTRLIPVAHRHALEVHTSEARGMRVCERGAPTHHSRYIAPVAHSVGVAQDHVCVRVPPGLVEADLTLTLQKPQQLQEALGQSVQRPAEP